MASHNETVMYFALKEIAQSDVPDDIRAVAEGALARADWEQRAEPRQGDQQ